MHVNITQARKAKGALIRELAGQDLSVSLGINPRGGWALRVSGDIESAELPESVHGVDVHLIDA